MLFQSNACELKLYEGHIPANYTFRMCLVAVSGTKRLKWSEPNRVWKVRLQKHATTGRLWPPALSYVAQGALSRRAPKEEVGGEQNLFWPLSWGQTVTSFAFIWWCRIQGWGIAAFLDPVLIIITWVISKGTEFCAGHKVFHFNTKCDWVLSVWALYGHFDETLLSNFEFDSGCFWFRALNYPEGIWLLAIMSA